MMRRTPRLSGQLVLWVSAALLVIPVLQGCDYARMKEDEALRTYERALPEMPKGTVPKAGGQQVLPEANPSTLVNPLPPGPESIARGAQAYQYYCVQCHGPNGDGKGTVGQSFAPLPTNLKGRPVQEQTDGDLFYRISFGFNRHPPLFYTAPEEDRWAVIHFMRSLAAQPVDAKGKT